MSWILRLIELSVARRELTLLITLGLTALALAGLSYLRLDAFPDLTNVQVQVLTASPGMDTVEVERLVTLPIERALGGLPGMSSSRSISRTGISAITVVFEDGTSLWHARQLVKERIDMAREEIPAQAGIPELGPPSTGLGEVYQFMLRSESHRGPELYRLFERDVAPLLRQVEGVVEVNAWGGGEPQLDVWVDADALASRGMSLGALSEAIEAQVGRVSGGAGAQGHEQTLLAASANPDSPEALSALPVRMLEDGSVLRLGDVATVRESGALTVGLGSADARGEALFVMVQLLAGADALATTRAIQEAMPGVERALPEGVEVELIYEREKLVASTLNTVKWSLLEGGLLVVLVLFVMLGDLRAGLVVASVIPLSLLGALSALTLLGYSGNLMSLGAIDFGLVVDGAVVVVESIMALSLSRDTSLRRAVVERAQHVASPVLFAIGILLLVYVPILTLSGSEGKLFKPMALTVLFALLTALVLSFTYVPALSSLILRPKGHANTRLMRFLEANYTAVLGALLLRPGLSLVGVLVALALSVAAGSRLGVEFVPRLQEGDIVVQTARLPSINAEEALRGATRVEAALRGFPEVEAVATRSGSPALATDPMGLEEADVLVRLTPRSTWTSASDTEGLIVRFEEAILARDGSAQLNFTQPIEMRFNELLEGITSDVGVKIFGPDADELLRLADVIAARLERVEGASDVTRPSLEGVPALSVTPDAEALSRYGLTPQDVLRAVAMQQRGLPVAEVVREDFRDPIVLKLAPGVVMRPLSELPLAAPSGEVVALGVVARIERVEHIARMDHEQGSRRVIVKANVRGRDLGSFMEEAQRAVDELPLPPGYRIAWGGKYEQLQDASRSLSVILPATVLMIIVLLGLAFKRWQPTLLIALNVPVALSGGLVILWVRQMPLSIPAMIGCLALFGIAVMDGIVLLSRAQELHQRLRPAEAMRRASIERLRPVLTTTLVAGLGFLPMAFATGVGAEVQRPLATVVVGGLLSSTLLTLLALPPFYVWLYRNAGPLERDADEPGIG